MKVLERVKAKEQVLAGISAPMNYFDPLGFTTPTTAGKLLFYREVELKHGSSRDSDCHPRDLFGLPVPRSEPERKRDVGNERRPRARKSGLRPSRPQAYRPYEIEGSADEGAQQWPP